MPRIDPRSADHAAKPPDAGALEPLDALAPSEASDLGAGPQDAALASALAGELLPLSSGAARTWTRAIDELAFDAPGDGSLWVRGVSYKARIAADGFTYVPFLGSQAPRNWPVRFELREARLGGRSLPLVAPDIERAGAWVTLDRGALLERYRFELEQVEQLFVLDELDGAGDLELVLEIESDLAARAEGAGLEFSGPEGRVRYGGVTVLDAAGRALALPSRLEGGRIVLRVPADFVASAALPLTVDPIVTTLSLDASLLHVKDLDVASAAGIDTYMVVWEEVYSAVDSDVYSLLVEYPFGVHGQYIDVSTESWAAPTIASNHLAQTYLVAAEAGGEIRGRYRQTNGLAMGAVKVLATDVLSLGNPSLGGDPSPDSPTYYLLAYERHLDPNNVDIRAALIDGFGVPVQSNIVIDNSAGTIDFAPQVSKTLGAPPYATQRWNVVWGRVVPGQVRYAQLGWNGTVLTASRVLKSSLEGISTFAASPPVDDESGAPREWLAVYGLPNGANTSIVGVAVDEGSVLFEVPLKSVPGQVASLAVDSQGCTYALSYVGASNVGQNAAWLTTVRALGTELKLTDPPTYANPAGGAASGIAIAHGPAEVGSAFAVWNEGPSGQASSAYGSFYALSDGCVGETSCHSLANSSGYEAYLHAVGSAKVLDNNLWMECENLPPFKPGLMLTSNTLGIVNIGSGVLCLAFPIHRFALLLQNSGPEGVMDMRIDLQHPPVGVDFAPGSTWHFQYWTRDVGTTNFSNSVKITFQ